MASGGGGVGGCVWTCFILSFSAILILPIWAYMLFQHSVLFEIPTKQKTRAGWACVVATLLYILSGLYCLFRIIQAQRESFKFRVSRDGYSNGRQQVEMKPLLDDHSSSDNSDMGAGVGATSSVEEADPPNNITPIIKNRDAHLNPPSSPSSSPQILDRGGAPSHRFSNTSGTGGHLDDYRSPHSSGSQSSRESPGSNWRSPKRSPGRWSDAKASRRVFYEDLPS